MNKLRDKVKVLLFARSFLAEYYSDFESDIIEPIFVTLTHEEKTFLEGKGWNVYGCFEDEYESLKVAKFADNYLKTSFHSDRFLGRFDHEKRMEILGKEISFWSRIFDTTSPSFLVNETIAVEIAEVMAIEAKKRNIPFYTSLLGFIPGTFYWKPDPFTGRLNDINSIEPDEKAVTMARTYVKNMVEKQERPFYVANTHRRNVTIKKLLSSFIGDAIRYIQEKNSQKFKIFRYEDYSSFFFANQREFVRKLKYSYDNFELFKKKNYLFYPMHVEPEAILSYFVPENYTQIEVIENIIKAAKVNQSVIVKEHPQHPGILLSDKFQELKKIYSNLYYLPSYELSFPILDRCDAVVTLTSSVGWEALVLGKPVFVLGEIFFDQCNGVKRIESFRQLKDELRKEEYVLPNKDQIETFAAQMISQFHKGCPSPMSSEKGLNHYVSEIEKIACR